MPRPPRLVPRLLPHNPFWWRRARFDAAPIVVALLGFGAVSMWIPEEGTHQLSRSERLW